MPSGPISIPAPTTEVANAVMKAFIKGVWPPDFRGIYIPADPKQHSPMWDEEE